MQVQALDPVGVRRPWMLFTMSISQSFVSTSPVCGWTWLEWESEEEALFAMARYAEIEAFDQMFAVPV